MTEYKTPREAVDAAARLVCDCCATDVTVVAACTAPRHAPDEWETEGEDALGTHEPMSSPGIATLKVDALRRFFRGYILAPLVAAQLPLLDRDCELLCRWTISVTAEHELFHHLCDLLRHHPTRSRPDRNEEEPLAVGWSWHRLVSHPLRGDVWRSPLLDVWPNAALVSAILDARFGSYTNPPYSGWERHDRKLRSGWCRRAAAYLGETPEALEPRLLALAYEAYRGTPDLAWRVELP